MMFTKLEGKKKPPHFSVSCDISLTTKQKVGVGTDRLHSGSFCILLSLIFGDIWVTSMYAVAERITYC